MRGAQTWLDCDDVASTLVSFAGALGIRLDELENALREYDEARFSDYSEDPQERMPREVVEEFGSDVERLAGRFEGIYLFHGTRVVNPETFRHQGILPLAEMVEPIWRMLYELVREECGPEEWAAFRRSVEVEGTGGHDGWLYRLKTVGGGLGAAVNQGPYGMLVREFFFQPEETSSHDYLGCPEIVQDIARCYASAGADLEQRFCAATVPCIVKFRFRQVLGATVSSALWYAFTMLRERELTTNARWGFDCEGRPVPPEDVVEVEVGSSRAS